MADFTLTVGTNTAAPLDLPQVISGDVNWDMSGQYNGVFLYSKQRKIETTVSTGTTPTNATRLEENYDTSLEAGWTKDLSDTDTKYNQVYVRWATDPLSTTQYAAYDFEDIGTTGLPILVSPIGYRDFGLDLVREFTDATPQVAVDYDDQSAYGFLKDGTDWKRLKDAGFLLDVSNEGNAPSLKFMARGATVDKNKANDKTSTISVMGYTRLLTTNYVMPTGTDFAPYKTMVKDQYRRESIYKSRRLGPAGLELDGLGVNDSTEQSSYTDTIGERSKQSNISATFVLDGDFEINDGGLRPLKMGDKLTTLTLRGLGITPTGYVVTINLPITDVTYDPMQDNTTISVGRL